MIDLGSLVAKIVVDSADGVKKLQDFGNNAETAEKKSGGLVGTLKKLAAGFAIGTVIKKTADAVIGMVIKADELKQSLNTLQTQTGTTDEEMAGLEQSLKDIYANNYGESFEDIATSMAEVKNQTGLANEELERATENAIALRDTFGYEVQESTRAADMLMKQFGLTSDEAFNLLAQGGQSGLDKNGNLLDSINEYSVHFKQLGFNSEEMFNMFANGAKTGVFDVDKLGDAVKEFGIRAKDGSTTTIEAYQMLGLNADELQAKFAEGGESAQDAFTEVTKALNDCDDEVIKNTAGVNLFGTMWEDMGSDAVKALSDTNGEFSTTSDNLNKIKEIKYDDLNSAFSGIKRQLETGLIIPIGEKLLPKVNEFANWIQANMPQIQATFEGVMNGISMAVTFVTDNLNIIIPVLGGALAGFMAFQIVTTIGGLMASFSAVTQGTTGIMAALNAVMAANPFVLVALAVAGLVAAGVALYMNWDTVKQKCEELFNKLSEIWENIKTTVTTKIEEMKTAINDKINDFKEAGKRVFTGFWDGLKAVWTSITGWVSEKISSITDSITGVLDFLNPFGESDGSHRTGLYEVPYDGYKSILHKGEMVLTQPEADRYKNGESKTVNEGDFIVNIEKFENSNGRSTEDFYREMEFYRKSRKAATGGI